MHINLFALAWQVPQHIWDQCNLQPIAITVHDQFSRWGALLHIYTGNNNVTAFYDKHLQFPNRPEIQHNH